MSIIHSTKMTELTESMRNWIVAFEWHLASFILLLLLLIYKCHSIHCMQVDSLHSLNLNIHESTFEYQMLNQDNIYKFACTLSVWHLRHQPSLQGPQPPRPSAVRVCRSVASSSKIKSPDYDIIICLHFKLIIRGLSSRCRQHRGEYRISHDQHQ